LWVSACWCFYHVSHQPSPFSSFCNFSLLCVSTVSLLWFVFLHLMFSACPRYFNQGALSRDRTSILCPISPLWWGRDSLKCWKYIPCWQLTTQCILFRYFATFQKGAIHRPLTDICCLTNRHFQLVIGGCLWKC
jgi:hypothetical protein